MKINRYDSGPFFSKLVVTDTTVYTAGLVADDLSVGVKEQTKQVLKAIGDYLSQGGTDKSKLLTANVWLKDIGDFSQFNEAWLEWIDTNNLPVRATVEAKMGNPKVLVEIMVTASL